MKTIGDTIDLMKTVMKRSNSLTTGYDPNKSSMFNISSNNSSYTNNPYTDFVKEDLYNNFIKIADKLHFDGRTKLTGMNFIQELINKVSTKNYSMNINKDNTDTVTESVHNCIIESYGKRRMKRYRELNKISGFREDVQNTITDSEIEKFNREIEISTPEKINQKIAERVEKATSDFIAERNEKNDMIKEIYAKAKTFMGSKDPNANSMGSSAQTVNPEPSQQESARYHEAKAKREINALKNKPVSLFEAMVEGLANAAMINKDLNKRYMLEGGALDMDAIIDDTAAVYTIMEECNVYGLYKIDKDFISAYLKGLRGN